MQSIEAKQRYLVYLTPAKVFLRNEGGAPLPRTQGSEIVGGAQQ